ncbi:MAG: L-seryl-tRNA(Sec) selenium transferase [Thermotaleaceae bacterium]
MNRKDLFCLIPKVDDILKDKSIGELLLEFPRTVIIDSIRYCIENFRQDIVNLAEEDLKSYFIDQELLIKDIIVQVEKSCKMNLKKVINGTGVVLHTNLGRSLLCDEIKDAVWDIASSYSTLEFNTELGQRGSRYEHVENILAKLTGAEGAMVVNNNAAAVLLILGSMARDKEVIVSRGQLVEIGGSFRVPDIMKQSGAKLVEVGTTNKTHLSDYEEAIYEDTGILLKVHTSNYKILGFTKEVSLAELVSLGSEHNIPVVEDIGSGTLIDFSKYGLEKEPTVQESIAAGVDIVSFSGDKLLGGPQAGIILGKKKYIDLMKKNPLTRAIRVDKLTLAALEATLRIYLDEEKAIKKIPTLNMLTMTYESIEKRALKLFDKLKSIQLDSKVSIEKGLSQVGGGAMPLEELPTALITIKPIEKTLNQVERELRGRKIPIITRISEEKLIFDCRTIKDEEFDILIEALNDILGI